MSKTKWLIENNKTEWFNPHFYIWNSGTPYENHVHESVYEWVTDANRAWEFYTKEEAENYIEKHLKYKINYRDMTFIVTEHEFI